MRTVPESIKLALQDPSLPIQKRILLYRRLDDLTGLLKNTTVGLYGGRGRIGMLVGVYF